MNRLQAALSSRKFQRALPWIAGGVLALGVITMLQVMNSPAKSEESSTPKRRAQLEQRQRTVPPSPEARRVVAAFIHTAVARKNLAAAWRISGPTIRGGLTYRQWLSGEIPVVPYDFDPGARTPVRLDWSYPNQASFAVTLLPRRGSDEVKEQIFFITVKRFGKGKKSRWLVDYWAPYAPPALPDSFSR